MKHNTQQYKKWQNELKVQKFILRQLDKRNKTAILDCQNKINELKHLMNCK